MAIQPLGGPGRIFLHPGDCEISRDCITLSTLLGSCVSVCLYDPVNRVFGMNHFLLANRRYARDIPVIASDVGRYGIHAMELLINKMLRAGADRRKFMAKAFGGGNVLGTTAGRDNFLCVGSVNVRFVKEFLSNEGIPLVAADLGGHWGRQIHFSGEDYAVYVRRIQTRPDDELIKEEREFWRHSMDEQEHASAQADFW